MVRQGNTGHREGLKIHGPCGFLAASKSDDYGAVSSAGAVPAPRSHNRGMYATLPRPPSRLLPSLTPATQDRTRSWWRKGCAAATMPSSSSVLNARGMDPANKVARILR